MGTCDLDNELKYGADETDLNHHCCVKAEGANKVNMGSYRLSLECYISLVCTC